MTDCFACLDQVRRPWLDSEAIKERFHRLTAEHHPDVNGGTGVDFAGVISAYQILRDPKTRLRHLLELEFPETVSDPQQIPTDLLDLFMQIANALSAFGKILKKLNATSSPLALALLAAERLAVLGQLKAISNILIEKEESLLDQLRLLDARWPEDKAATADPLSRILQQLSFLGKWSDQIREAILCLET